MIQVNRLEDSATQAGWMFADLFLALTVIFLATIPFVPKDVTGKVVNNQQLNSATSQEPGLNKQILISNGFIAEYKVRDYEAFREDLITYLKSKNLLADTKLVFIETIGHQDASDTSTDQGNLDAINFLINSKKLMPKNLGNVNSSINLSNDVPKGFVRVKITLD